MNTRITEAINFNEVTSIFLSIGYMVYRPEADVDGVDFIVQTPSGDILKCQLKSRAYVEWDRYGGKNIFMVFPSKGEKKQRNWYFIEHDKLFNILKKLHGHAPKWSDKGGFWHCEVGPKLAEIIEDYKITV